MEIFTLLENLENLLEDSTKVPFSTKVLVDREELCEIVEDIRLKLPDEISPVEIHNPEFFMTQAFHDRNHFPVNHVRIRY